MPIVMKDYSPQPGGYHEKHAHQPSPNLQSFASLLDSQPPQVQEAFQFLLATAMHEAGKLELLNVAEVNRRWHHTFRGAGEVFSVVRLEMDREMGRQVREEVRKILAEEGLV